MTNYFEQEQKISPSLADASGRLGRFQAFNLFMDVADLHADALGISWRTISKRNLFWLTVKTKVVFADRPKIGETVTVSTWIDPPTRLRGDRSYEIRRGDEVLVRAKTEWAILNTASQKLVPISEVYPEGLDYSRLSACPEGFTRVKDHFETSHKYAEYTVRSTDIDIGHHMNNVQYVRALLGTFSNEELERWNPTSFDVIFRNSVYEGDLLGFYKQAAGGGSGPVDAAAQTGGDAAVGASSSDCTAAVAAATAAVVAAAGEQVTKAGAVARAGEQCKAGGRAPAEDAAAMATRAAGRTSSGFDIRVARESDNMTALLVHME